MKVKVEPFCFMHGHTIEGAIRMKNNYVSGPIIQELMKHFNQENGVVVPKLGQSFKIPVMIND